MTPDLAAVVERLGRLLARIDARDQWKATGLPASLLRRCAVCNIETLDEACPWCGGAIERVQP